MSVYTVHAPVGRRLSVAAGQPATDRFVFVRDGFHLWAAVFGVLWFAAHRLWLALIGYLVVMTLLVAGLWALNIGSSAVVLVLVLAALLTGLEAASLQRWALSRGRWRELDVVVARHQDEAERRFFDRFVDGRSAANETLPVDRGAPPPVRPFGSFGSHDEVMGLFPQPGASR